MRGKGIMKSLRKVKVIGAGGIGSHLIEPLSRYLHHSNQEVEITIYDGDNFEDRNQERQRCIGTENKAEYTVNSLKGVFQKIHFRAKSEYVTDENVITAIRENDVVFLCVDNHATRKLVSDRCEELDNVTLISGGNDYTDGNVIVYVRKDGKDVTKPPTALHPKIAKPDDKNPGDTPADRQGCDTQVNINPQLLFTNLAVASCMLNCYYGWEQDKVGFHQIYLDILSQRMRPSPDQ